MTRGHRLGFQLGKVRPQRVEGRAVLLDEEAGRRPSRQRLDAERARTAKKSPTESPRSHLTAPSASRIAPRACDRRSAGHVALRRHERPPAPLSSDHTHQRFPPGRPGREPPHRDDRHGCRGATGRRNDRANLAAAGRAGGTITTIVDARLAISVAGFAEGFRPPMRTVGADSVPRGPFGAIVEAGCSRPARAMALARCIAERLGIRRGRSERPPSRIGRSARSSDRDGRCPPAPERGRSVGMPSRWGRSARASKRGRTRAETGSFVRRRPVIRLRAVTRTIGTSPGANRTVTLGIARRGALSSRRVRSPAPARSCGRGR